MLPGGDRHPDFACPGKYKSDDGSQAKSVCQSPHHNSLHFKSRVERVAKPVAEQVESEHREKDR